MTRIARARGHPIGQQPHRRLRRGDDLVRPRLEPEPGELRRDRRRRPGGVVRDVADADAARPDGRERVLRVRHGGAPAVDDAVEVEQQDVGVAERRRSRHRRQAPSSPAAASRRRPRRVVASSVSIVTESCSASTSSSTRSAFAARVLPPGDLRLVAELLVDRRERLEQGRRPQMDRPADRSATARARRARHARRRGRAGRRTSRSPARPAPRRAASRGRPHGRPPAHDPGRPTPALAVHHQRDLVVGPGDAAEGPQLAEREREVAGRVGRDRDALPHHRDPPGTPTRQRAHAAAPRPGRPR